MTRSHAFVALAASALCSVAAATPAVAQEAYPTKVIHIIAPFPQQWWAVAAPKGTPRPIIDRINIAMAQMIDRPEVKERFAEPGVFPVHTTPERVLELVRIKVPEMARYLKMAGVEPD